MMEHSVRKPSGFTIDSIIGKDVDKTEKSSNSRNLEDNIHIIPQSYKTDSQRHSVKEKCDTLTSERLRREDLTQEVGRTTSDFSHLRRDIYLGHQQSTAESLKHLPDVLSQIAGATGTYFPPRVCRHPLSSFNLHSMYPSQLPPSAPLHPLMLNSSATRDIRSLHPWIERYPSYYYHRYPAAPGFLFQPYRKPKRIRTAFSPSQLLQLEKAFEKSHYVVGQERKDLAAELQLTETQVKVWFQNRRTKHKRIKSEDGEVASSPDNSCKYLESDDDMKNDSDISDIEDIGNEGHIPGPSQTV